MIPLIASRFDSPLHVLSVAAAARTKEPSGVSRSVRAVECGGQPTFVPIGWLVHSFALTSMLPMLPVTLRGPPSEKVISQYAARLRRALRGEGPSAWMEVPVTVGERALRTSGVKNLRLAAD